MQNAFAYAISCFAITSRRLVWLAEPGSVLLYHLSFANDPNQGAAQEDCSTAQQHSTSRPSRLAAATIPAECTTAEDIPSTGNALSRLGVYDSSTSSGPAHNGIDNLPSDANVDDDESAADGPEVRPSPLVNPLTNLPRAPTDAYILTDEHGYVSVRSLCDAAENTGSI